MKIIKLKKNIKIPQSIIALGFFDGVHPGHQKVIKTAVSYSKILNIPSLVFTFKSHPKSFLKEHELILSYQDKVNMLKNLGIDYLVWIDFNKNFSEILPHNFVKKILVDMFHARIVIVGFNYHFGYKAEGSASDLIHLGQKFGFQAKIIPPYKIGRQTLSSTLIRKLITSGKLSKANKLLGFNFYINGKVVKGSGIGKNLKFHTANVNWPSDIVQLPMGVYAVFVKYRGKLYKGAANLGTSPTMGGKIMTLETHIFDFNKDIYGKKIQIFFKAKIRDEKKFMNIEELKKQIQKDIIKINRILSQG